MYLIMTGGQIKMSNYWEVPAQNFIKEELTGTPEEIVQKLRG